MTSPAQAASNAVNAQSSTGPRTEAGKAASARNALKHGYYASDVLMPGEDAAQFAHVLARVQDTWQPTDDEQRELVDEIVVALWRRRRLRRAEAETWAEVCALGDAPRSLGEAFVADSGNGANAIEKLRRWWQGNERHLNRCTDRLALMKRLATLRAPAPPPEQALDQRRAARRDLDLFLSAPVPGELERLADAPFGEPIDPVNEMSHPQEQTQTTAEPSPEPSPEPSAPAPAPAPEVRPPALNRRQRRALERQHAKQAKTERHPERSATQAA